MTTTWHGTTILCVRRDDSVIMIGDGQVTLGSCVLKSTARKIRKLSNGSILVGFAGATADAFTLLDRLEKKIESYPQNLTRACVELAKDWRTDKYLRKLEAMIIVADKSSSFVLTGNGDVLEPEDNVCAIGSGGLYALSAARALISEQHLSLDDIATRSMKIASDLCVYTNMSFTVERL